MRNRLLRLRVLAATSLLLIASGAGPAVAGPPNAATGASVRAMNSIYYTYYQDASKTVVVGHGYKYCDGTFEQIDGEWSRYYTTHTFPC